MKMEEKKVGGRKKGKESADEQKNELSIEERFARLDELIDEMEAEDCPLERSFQLYEEGMKLIAGAEAQVDKVEKQLRILNGEEEADGSGETQEG